LQTKAPIIKYPPKREKRIIKKIAPPERPEFAASPSQFTDNGIENEQASPLTEKVESVTPHVRVKVTVLDLCPESQQSASELLKVKVLTPPVPVATGRGVLSSEAKLISLP